MKTLAIIGVVLVICYIIKTIAKYGNNTKKPTDKPRGSRQDAIDIYNAVNKKYKK